MGKSTYSVYPRNASFEASSLITWNTYTVSSKTHNYFIGL